MRRTLMFLWGALAGANVGLAIAHLAQGDSGAAWSAFVLAAVCSVAAKLNYELLKWED